MIILPVLTQCILWMSSSSSTALVSSFSTIPPSTFLEKAIASAAASQSNNNRKSKNHPSLQIETKFVLIGTKHPGNVGSSARSMKTMGFTNGLVLVDPNDPKVPRRKKCIDAASGALDVLESAEVVIVEEHDKESLVPYALQKAFGDHTSSPILVCGTGMPVDMAHQRTSQNYVEPRRLFEEIIRGLNRDNDNDDDENSPPTSTTLRIAFLFGNERFGMASKDMEKCDVMLGIPTNPEFGSLNLATAVQIIAYDWRQALGGFDHGGSETKEP